MPLDDEQYRSLAAFRYALRRFLAFSEAAVKRAGVTAQQYQALLVIKSRPGESALIRELADELLLPHNAAVQLADRLATAGLAVRSPSSSDRRSVSLRLTGQGETVLSQLAADHLRQLLAQEQLLADSLGRLRGMAPVRS